MKNTANWVLAILASFIFFFIIAMIVTYWRFQMVPDTLIQYTLGAGGVECLFLAGIKITKVLKGDKNDDSENDSL